MDANATRIVFVALYCRFVPGHPRIECLEDDYERFNILCQLHPSHGWIRNSLAVINWRRADLGEDGDIFYEDACDYLCASEL